MKYCMIVIACALVAGCVSKGPRHNPRMKGYQPSKHVEKNQKPSHKNRVEAAKRRIKIAVGEGKMTQEEAKEMLDKLNQRSKRSMKNKNTSATSRR